MLGLKVAQVNKGEEFESNPSGQWVKNRDYTQNPLGRAKRRRKLVTSPDYANPSGTTPAQTGVILDSGFPVNKIKQPI
jgi:hypothetical protein